MTDPECLMDEKLWLGSNNPGELVAAATDEIFRKATPGRNLLGDDRLMALAEAVEAQWWQRHLKNSRRSPGQFTYDAGGSGSRMARACVRQHNLAEDATWMSDTLREVLGNPFRETVLTDRCRECGGCGQVGPCGLTDYYRACWTCGKPGDYKGSGLAPAPFMTEQVKSLAEQAAGDLEACGILADALEDAGCDQQELLRHLRGFKRCHRCLGEGFWTDPMRGSTLVRRVGCAKCEGRGWLPTAHDRHCWAVALVNARFARQP